MLHRSKRITTSQFIGLSGNPGSHPPPQPCRSRSIPVPSGPLLYVGQRNTPRGKDRVSTLDSYVPAWEGHLTFFPYTSTQSGFDKILL